MSDLKLTTSVTSQNPVLHDLELTNGQSTLTEEVGEATAQRLRIRLQFIKGEWFLDQREGIDLFGKVLVKAPDLSSIAGLYRKAILGTDGVASVSKVNIEFSRGVREGRLTFSAVTDEGATLDFDEPFIVTQ